MFKFTHQITGICGDDKTTFSLLCMHKKGTVNFVSLHEFTVLM